MAKRAFGGVVAGGVAAAGLATTVVLAAPASAQTIAGQAVSATAQSDPAPSGKPKYCHRTDTANTRGSIAWLQAKAQATSSSNPELSKLLTDLATLRSQVKDPAATIVADLQAVQQAH